VRVYSGGVRLPDAAIRRLAMGKERVRITSPIQAYLAGLHAKYVDLHEGQVATYIPELAKANPNWFGICLATTDGALYEVGDTRQPFTIQSISKPLTYGLALEDHGREAVLAKIGVEPTGDAFNSISLAPDTGCPLNPMINAGAIAAASLVAGRSAEDRLNRLLSVFSTYAGRALTLDHAVYESERATGHRNRAIAHMLRNFDIVTDDPEPSLNLYFQQCSIVVTCRDLSLIAATLANGGINPVSGDRAVRSEFVHHILGVMSTCGMYDYAGDWLYWVGMPAKSGVGGGILAVVPGQLGIGVFSPPLDVRGNSVRGVAVCKDLSVDLDLHLMMVPRFSRSAVRAHYTLEKVRSKRLRNTSERQALDQTGDRACVVELQGDLTFAAAEACVRRVVNSKAATQSVILDFHRVASIDDCAARLLFDLFVHGQSAGVQLLFVNLHQHLQFRRFLEERSSATARHPKPITFPDIDPALEWCEDQLLEALPHAGRSTGAVDLRAHEICWGLSAAELARLEPVLTHRSFRAGTLIVRKGEPADEIYLLSHGEASVVVDLANGQLKRLATVSPGMAFGELAVVNRSPRSADVRADTEVECYALSTQALDALGDAHPRIKIQILENLLRNLAQILARANRELAALAE
jgi:glutaminase